MNIPLPSWLRPAAAPLPDLELQLSEARAALHDAEETVAAALADFDNSPDPRAERALVEARAAATIAAERVGRAERLLAPARAQAAEAEREALRARRGELEQEIAALEAQAPALVLAERDAWLAIIAARAARDDHDVRIRAVTSELLALSSRLGDDATGARMSLTWRHWPSGGLVARALMATLQRGASDVFVAEDGQRRFVMRLAVAAEKT